MNCECNLEDVHHEYDECGELAAAFTYNFSSL